MHGGEPDASRLSLGSRDPCVIHANSKAALASGRALRCDPDLAARLACRDAVRAARVRPVPDNELPC
eukprot:4411406-Alexandrium_andersonii.AAC.1